MRLWDLASTVGFTLLGVIFFMSFPVPARCGQLQGIFALGEGKPIPAAVLNSPWVDGIALRYTWKRLEPHDEEFNWVQLDNDIAQAHRYKKVVSIGITAGIKTPPWVYQAGATQFSYIWDKPWGPPACSRQRIPIPWDSAYLSKWKRFVEAFASRYNSDPSIVYIKMTGINAGTQELILPHSQDREKAVSSAGCSAGDQIRDWHRAGYTRRKIKSAWLDIVETFGRAFPHKSLGLMIGPRGFPPIDDSGNIIPGRGADLAVPNDLIAEGVRQIGQRFVLQNNGLSAVKGWAKLSEVSQRVTVGWQMIWAASDDPRCRMSGGLSPCDAHTVLTAATDRGLYSGARFIEIYLADLTNPQLQGVLERTHNRLMSHTTADRDHGGSSEPAEAGSLEAIYRSIAGHR